MTIDDQEVLAVSRRRIEAVTGVKMRTVDYWTSSGIVQPTTDARLSPRRIIRHYGYLDVMALVVIRQLRERGVSLQHIREIAAWFVQQGFRRPLTEIRYAVSGKNVFMQLPDGEWVDGRKPNQEVIIEVLPLEPIRALAWRARERARDELGQVERRRGALGSKELVAGTRIPVETVRRYLQAGRTTEQIIESFPVLTAADIESIASRRSA